MMLAVVAAGLPIIIDERAARDGARAMMASDRVLDSVARSDPGLASRIEDGIVDELSGMEYTPESLAMALSALEEGWRTGIRVRWRSVPPNSGAVRILDVRTRVSLRASFVKFAESVSNGKGPEFARTVSEILSGMSEREKRKAMR
jgi:hypothetical protein